MAELSPLASQRTQECSQAALCDVVVVCLNEYSEVLSLKRGCVLDGASEDIDVGDGGNDESLSSVVAVVMVIVSAWPHVTKWLLALG